MSVECHVSTCGCDKCKRRRYEERVRDNIQTTSDGAFFRRVPLDPSLFE